MIYDSSRGCNEVPSQITGFLLLGFMKIFAGFPVSDVAFLANVAAAENGSFGRQKVVRDFTAP